MHPDTAVAAAVCFDMRLGSSSFISVTESLSTIQCMLTACCCTNHWRESLDNSIKRPGKLVSRTLRYRIDTCCWCDHYKIEVNDLKYHAVCGLSAPAGVRKVSRQSASNGTYFETEHAHAVLATGHQAALLIGTDFHCFDVVV